MLKNKKEQLTMGLVGTSHQLARLVGGSCLDLVYLPLMSL